MPETRPRAGKSALEKMQEKSRRDKVALQSIMHGIRGWLNEDTPPESTVINLLYAFSRDPDLLDSFVDLVSSRSEPEEYDPY